MTAAIIFTMLLNIYLGQHGEYLNILDIVLLSTAAYVLIGLFLICRKEK